MRRYVPGFTLINEHAKSRIYPVKQSITIARGDCLKLTAGYAELATTLQQTTPILIGIANSANAAADATADGTLNVEVLPLLPQYDWLVPCEDDAAIVQTDVGTLRDLQSEDGIDNGDTVTAGLGFFIDEIDVSSAALAAAAFGYAIGHFESIFAS